jgi:hypothetical protein
MTSAQNGQPAARLPVERLDVLQVGLATPLPTTVTSTNASKKTKTPPRPTDELFAVTRLLNPSHDEERDVRLPRLMELNAWKAQHEDLQDELMSHSRPGSDLYNGIRHTGAVVKRLNDEYEADFIPQHRPLQGISPRVFLQTRLFRIRSRTKPREANLTLTLSCSASDYVRFVGPELRQDDGLVFMVLLNLCRDYRVGKQACFNVARMTTLLWGSYNGQTRKRLKDCVQRLQRSTIEFPEFTVQLVQHFGHPKRGDWYVALHRSIVALFERERYVWLDLTTRLRLEDGLTSWLYGYICSQTTLIPWSIDDLRECCGSSACSKTFREMLSNALKQLALEGVIDGGWWLDDAKVHWRKAGQPKRRSTVRKDAAPAAPEQASLPYDEAAEAVLRPARRRE